MKRGHVLTAWNVSLPRAPAAHLLKNDSAHKSGRWRRHETAVARKALQEVRKFIYCFLQVEVLVTGLKARKRHVDMYICMSENADVWDLKCLASNAFIVVCCVHTQG